MQIFFSSSEFAPKIVKIWKIYGCAPFIAGPQPPGSKPLYLYLYLFDSGPPLEMIIFFRFAAWTPSATASALSYSFKAAKFNSSFLSGINQVCGSSGSFSLLASGSINSISTYRNNVGQFIRWDGIVLLFLIFSLVVDFQLLFFFFFFILAKMSVSHSCCLLSNISGTQPRWHHLQLQPVKGTSICTAERAFILQ